MQLEMLLFGGCNVFLCLLDLLERGFSDVPYTRLHVEETRRVSGNMHSDSELPRLAIKNWAVPVQPPPTGGNIAKTSPLLSGVFVPRRG